MKITLPSSKRSLAQDRRDYIVKRVDALGEVHDRELSKYRKENDLKWGISSQSLKEDAAYFAKNNIPILRPLRATKFVRYLETHGTYELRKGILAGEKAAIGQLAADLIRGANIQEGGVQYVQSKIFDMLRNHARITSRLRVAQSLISKLKLLYGKYNRLCALDSGTTTLAAAQVLAVCGNQMLPDITSCLKSLEIITNSTEIAQKLGKVTNSIGVVCIGGRLRKETQAFAGDLTEECLSAWNFQLDMSIVGCVGIQVKKWFAGIKDERDILSFMSDTKEEASAKQALFARSNLRVILMDSSKFQLGGKESMTVGHFVFAPLAGNHVDLVITDSGVMQDSGPAGRLARERVEECWEQGVAVLIAEKSKT